MRLPKAWFWLLLPLAALGEDLPREDRLPLELEPVRKLKGSRPVQLKTYPVRALKPEKSVAVGSSPVWRPLQVAEGVLSPGVSRGVDPIGQQAQPIGDPRLGIPQLRSPGTLEIDSHVRTFRAYPQTVGVDDVPWWISLEQVWGGGPVGRMRGRVNEEMEAGRISVAEELQMQYWKAYQRALERRKAFEVTGESQPGRRRRE